MVVDLDSPGAVEAFRNQGYEPHAITKKGAHIYFRHPRLGKITSTVDLLEEESGVDRKADGGLVELPSPLSIKEWTGEGFPELASLEVLPHFLREDGKSNERAVSENGHLGLARALDGVPEGERDDVLFRYACSLRARECPKNEAAVLVLHRAAKCDPPFPPEEALKKVANAYGAYPPGVGSKIHSQHSHSLIGTGTVGMNESTNVVNLKKPLQAVSLGTVTRPKPRRWVVENLIPRGHMSLIYGEGGKAKSYLALDLAFNVASDVETWLDYGIVTGPALYIDFELDQGEQARCAHDLAAGKGLDRPPDNLLYLGALGYTAQEAFQRRTLP